MSFEVFPLATARPPHANSAFTTNRRNRFMLSSSV
jgi:hypothetical protein